MEAGDEARAAELRTQLREQFGGRGGRMQVMFDEIEGVLHEDQLETFQHMRERMRQSRDHGRQMWRTVRELPDAVGMTEEQREAYRAMLRQRWEEMREQMRQRWEQDGGGMQWETPDFAALEDDFYAQVAGLLSADQQLLLSDYRAQFASEQFPVEPQRTADARTVIQAMKRVRGLSDQQRKALREIERDAKSSFREVRRDKALSAQLAADVKTRIISVLTEEQVKQFEDSLDRLRPTREREPSRPRTPRQSENPPHKP
jgi:ribosome recycling factor